MIGRVAIVAVCLGMPLPVPAAAPDPIPVRVALQTEAAIGVGTGGFYNHLAGGRLDLGFSPRVSFGGYLGYANLKGKDGRTSNVLSYAQVEYRARDPAARVRVPLRFASGYLPGNGPIVRLAAGLAFALSPSVDLVTEFAAPMIWISNNRMLLSMNLAVEMGIRF